MNDVNCSAMSMVEIAVQQYGVARLRQVLERMDELEDSGMPPEQMWTELRAHISNLGG